MARQRKKHKELSEIESENRLDDKPLTLFGKVEDILVKLFWPEFEELPVALMAISVILVILFTAEVQKEILRSLNQDDSWKLMIFGLIVAYTLLRSVYHLFVIQKKTNYEKRAMVRFAAYCCGFAGVVGGLKSLATGEAYVLNLAMVFVNLLQGGVLLLLAHFEVVDESNMSDEESPLAGSVANIGVVIILFFLLKEGLGMHWFEVFSILVAYAATFASPVADIVERLLDWMFATSSVRTQNEE
ncbi:MAG: hypothetical protein ACD_39C00426G0002 [uncultured bacterium]|nr:MAG: hypothetical protein ACD_39C00426G0002 [uncultured bacterium]